MEKSKIINKLENGWVRVTFTKKDGTVRKMVATRNHELYKGSPIVDKSENVTVYEQENGFRSFDADSVSEIESM